MTTLGDSQSPDDDDDDKVILSVAGGVKDEAVPEEVAALAQSMLPQSDKPQFGILLGTLLANVLIGFVTQCVEERLKSRLTKAKKRPFYRMVLLRKLAKALPEDFEGVRVETAARMLDKGYDAIDTPVWKSQFPATA